MSDSANFYMLVVGGAVLLAVIVFVTLLYEKKRTAGLFFWERLGLYDRGAQATAMVLQRMEVSSSVSGTIVFHLDDIVLEVRGEGAPPFRASVRYELPSSKHSDVREGETVPVRFDPKRPSRLIIDWRTMAASRLIASESQHAAEERRRAELLDPKKRG